MTGGRTLADAERPPARIDFEDPGFRTDPWPVYAWYREHAPVHFSEELRSFVVVGHDLVRESLTSPDLTAHHPFRSSRRAFGPSMLDEAGDRHRLPRNAVGRVLRPRAVRGLAEQVVRPLVENLLDEFVARPGELSDRLSERLPMAVTCRLTGIPERDAGWLQTRMRPLIRYVDHEAVPLEEVARNRTELRDYLAGLLDRGVGEEHFLGALAAEDGLTERDVVNNGILLLAAGTETTSAAITTLLTRVAAEPGLFDRLRADRTLIPAVVAETLRHQPPLHFTLRFAARDLELRGVPLPAGSAVQVCLGSANRDPAAYPDPDRWDLTRRGPMPLAFGAGPHICLGMGLATAELEILLDGLLDRLSLLRLDGPAPVVAGRTFRYARGLRLDLRTCGGNR